MNTTIDEIESLTEAQRAARGVVASESVAKQMEQNTLETIKTTGAQLEDNLFTTQGNLITHTFGLMKAYGGAASQAAQFGAKAFEKEDQEILGITFQAAAFLGSTAVGLVEAHRNWNLVNKQLGDLTEKIKNRESGANNPQPPSGSDGGPVTVSAGAGPS